MNSFFKNMTKILLFVHIINIINMLLDEKKIIYIVCFLMSKHCLVFNTEILFAMLVV